MLVELKCKFSATPKLSTGTGLVKGLTEVYLACQRMLDLPIVEGLSCVVAVFPDSARHVKLIYIRARVQTFSPSMILPPFISYTSVPAQLAARPQCHYCT